MKFNHLLCAGTILLAFSACSKDAVENTPNGGNENGEGAYMSLSISLPNTPGSRALDDGDSTEAGTVDEQKVNSLLVLVYNKTDDALDVAETFDAAELIPDGPNPVAPGNITSYSVPAFKVDESGEKKVVIIVNPNSQFSTTSTLAEMRIAQELDKEGVAGISSVYTEGGATGFLMTNANTAVNLNDQGAENTFEPTPFYPDGSVAVNVTGTKTNPTPVTIPVERAVAKITDVSTEYTKTVTGGIDKVTFTKVALVNGNTKFFPIKSIRDSKVSGNDYVVDPNFNSPVAGTDFYFKMFSGDEADITEDDWKTLNSETPIADREAFYTLENTMIKETQMTAYTTGLYYKATYYLDGASTAANLYKFAGKVYNWSGLTAAAAGLGLDLGDLNNTTSTSAEFAAKGITKYTDGVCYYPYWIRHVNNNDPASMEVMEFGVVRNNVYKMTINSVKGIGTPDPVNPDPSTPDESSDAMLEVLVQVLPWTVRNNNVDF